MLYNIIKDLLFQSFWSPDSCFYVIVSYVCMWGILAEVFVFLFMYKYCIYFCCVFMWLWCSITSLFLHGKVTIDLELHFRKRTKSKSSSGPLAHYDVYLYRVPKKTRPSIHDGPRSRAVNGSGRGRVVQWVDNIYPSSPPCSICSPVSTHSLPASMITASQRSSTWTLKPCTPWSTAPHIWSVILKSVLWERVQNFHSGKQIFTGFSFHCLKRQAEDEASGQRDKTESHSD